ncbi:MAG: GNAT family N-acetyltransferase [Nitrosomonas sp.]|uniref:GNAT family N-acetyltransferase n=1 Tax=Nitrosomonas sp. TaxID=42353 RepID=UPI0025F67751|nr:GNAT family N-acetyltransferase [Nitrosomonas sp.]MBY0473995.1 GNAT family N-acetyltransferase [Nitrosomonas sp.]
MNYRDAVNLVPMQETDFTAFSTRVLSSYAETNVRAGIWLPEEALYRSNADLNKLLPDGQLTAKQLFLSIIEQSTGNKVGTMWAGPEPGSNETVYFLFDIYINEKYRRRGFASKSIRTLERTLTAINVRSIKLQVFVFNFAAREMYESLGYSIYSHAMIKHVMADPA